MLYLFECGGVRGGGGGGGGGGGFGGVVEREQSENCLSVAIIV